MNKAELVEAVAKAADISKAAAERAVNGALGAITTSLRRGQSVTLVGFGTFYYALSRRLWRNARYWLAIAAGAAVSLGIVVQLPT